MATYEFMVRIQHPNAGEAERQCELLRDSVHEHAKVIGGFMNGTTQVTPIKKIRTKRKKAPSA